MAKNKSSISALFIYNKICENLKKFGKFEIRKFLDCIIKNKDLKTKSIFEKRNFIFVIT